MGWLSPICECDHPLICYNTSCNIFFNIKDVFNGSITLMCTLYIRIEPPNFSILCQPFPVKSFLWWLLLFCVSCSHCGKYCSLFYGPGCHALMKCQLPVAEPGLIQLNHNTLLSAFTTNGPATQSNGCSSFFLHRLIGFGPQLFCLTCVSWAKGHQYIAP